MKLNRIEILETDPNRKGNLFERLMGDLFHSLGYNEPRLTIHKSGREIDLQATHRTEAKVAIAECKAHQEPVGGSDINKFIGSLDVEKRKLKKEKEFKKATAVGYFVSLSGFKETAIEQENEIENSRIILIDREKIINELIKGRILVSIEKAISSISPKDLTLVESADLVAFEKGWVWVLYYSNTKGQIRTHFSLVHAEGRPLVQSLVNQVIELDKKGNHLLKDLVYVGDLISIVDRNESVEISKAKYFNYLKNELGEVHFEGLPTDKEAGAIKVQLESIFVPLYLTQIDNRQNEDPEPDSERSYGVGEILNQTTRLAILAKPGAGKSTLIKRIAISYAFPDRRQLINDSLPDKDWFPIFFRCRELGEKVTQSITEIINNIPIRAEISAHLNGFVELVSIALQNGNALLLIDGLDEIAEDKNRILFVNQLRTFLATYPSIGIIVTSREAGFRVVGGSLAAYCEHYHVSSLTLLEITDLIVKWHKVVIDDSQSTREEAEKLAGIIIGDHRIRVLAENPLLLTTLLFVKRWAGYLPTKKSVLYQEMIKLLLVTWNVEGHDQLDIEEAEPQLCFVAYWMSVNGIQTITDDDLRTSLIDARDQMPEILGYTKISANEFIKRVESRSSLLIMSGHKKLSNGHMVQIYEFLHLSFQEYLTAKAIVKGYIPTAHTQKKKISLIKRYIDKENWKEIVPLIAVLLERDCKELIELLINESKAVANGNNIDELPATLLGSCLANEVQITPNLLKLAIEWFAKSQDNVDDSIIEIILNNKFGDTFRKECKEAFFSKYEDDYALAIGDVLAEIFVVDNNILSFLNTDNATDDFSKILSLVQSGERENICIGALGLMTIAYRERRGSPRFFTFNKRNTLFSELLKQLSSKDKNIILSVAWALTWCSEKDFIPSNLHQSYCDQLSALWAEYHEHNIKRVISWTLYLLLTPETSAENICRIDGLKNLTQNSELAHNDEWSPIVVLYLMHILKNKIDKEVARSTVKEFIKIRLGRSTPDAKFLKFAKAMGIDDIVINELKKNS